MNDAELGAFRRRLLQLGEELVSLEDTARRGSQTVELDQSSVGRLSRIEALQAQQIALDSDRRRQHLQRAIEGALRRIDSGDFGYCFVCDREIERARLETDPTLTRCIHCADHAG
ncbi:TraR/DksA family transcriptional regulator [Microbulbifer yueqingensis]|uniref:Transcriptional regulator, TraR/DksA family n=1 Tax=Microbulbifer yueqingensis TaxID=658219 RepID=A0A1G8XPB8_9GAMM|nr:TraR/DksA C4-type zinc finger protein [Microbulbifer yueqingensis]SDJ92388.1 transcriptional regulator, TraR/DksA family [Microbulbifer yueqingensis]